MREIKSPEVSESKRTEQSGFRQIKPESGITGNEA